MNNPIKRNIDIALLRTLVSVEESGGMTAAAERLNLTQAAVSQQIKRLEELFDAQLFSREKRQLVLTAKGERLLSFARRMVALNDETYNALVAPEFAGEVRLGVPYDIVGFFMPEILAEFRKAWPKIRVVLDTRNTRAQLAALKRGEVDIILTTEDKPRDQVLLAERLIWAGKRGGTAWQERPLPVSLGEQDCSFRPSVVASLSDAGLDWKVITHSGSLETTFTLLQADMFVTPLMQRTLPGALEILSLEKHGLPNLPVFYINKLMADTPNPLVQELSDFIDRGFAPFQKMKVA